MSLQQESPAPPGKSRGAIPHVICFVPFSGRLDLLVFQSAAEEMDCDLLRKDPSALALN